MRDFVILFIHLIVTVVRLGLPGGLRSVVAESVLASIERMRDAKGSRRKRAMPIAHEQILVVIDGRSIVEAYTKLRLPPNFSNSLPTAAVHTPPALFPMATLVRPPLYSPRVRRLRPTNGIQGKRERP